jgi:hypothetical protein
MGTLSGAETISQSWCQSIEQLTVDSQQLTVHSKNLQPLT